MNKSTNFLCLKIESSYVKIVWKKYWFLKKSTNFFYVWNFFFQMLECLKIESSYVYKYVWNFPNVIYTSMQLLIIEINIFKCKNSMKKSTDFWRKVLIFLCLKFFFSNVGMFKNWICICIQIRMKLSECDIHINATSGNWNKYF